MHRTWLTTFALMTACVITPLAAITLLDDHPTRIAFSEWAVRTIYSVITGTMIYAVLGRCAGQIERETAFLLLYGGQLALMIAALLFILW